MNFQCSTFARFSRLFLRFNDKDLENWISCNYSARGFSRLSPKALDSSVHLGPCPSLLSTRSSSRKNLAQRFLSQTKEEENEPRSPECLVEFTFYGNLAFSCALAAFFFSQCQKWSQFNVYTIKTNIKGHKGSKNSRRKHEEAQHKEFLSHRSLYMCAVRFWDLFNIKTRSSLLWGTGSGSHFSEPTAGPSILNILSGSRKHDDRCRRSANGHSSNCEHRKRFPRSFDTIQVPASILDSLRSAIS